MLDLSIQATNEVIIEGVLQEVDLREGTMEKPGQPARDYVAGTVTINVTQQVGGVEEVSEIPVSVFATKLKNDGNPNPAYKNIDDLRKNFVSMASGGASADTVRITRGELTENTFTTDGRTVTSFRIRNSFFNKVVTDSQQIAAFKNKIVLLSIDTEKDFNGADTERLCIKGALVRYGAQVDVLTYFVEDPVAIAYIAKNWHDGDTVNVSGRVRFALATVERKVEEVEVGFGEALPSTSSRRMRELIITSGSPGALDDDGSYDSDGDIVHALAERKARIAADAAKNSGNKATPAPATKQKAKFDGGF